MSRATPLRLVGLISGRGSNLQAILSAIASGELQADMSAVISNRPQAPGLEYARKSGIPTYIIDHKTYASRAGFDAALSAQIDACEPDLVLLAGFMRILGKNFIDHFSDRIVNIHPSLLPDYKGLDTHARVLAGGETHHGASVHLVTAELDEGPVIAQVKIPVLPQDTPDTLARRVLQQEHRLYPVVLAWFAQGRLKICQHRVYFDGEPLLRAKQIAPLWG